MAFDYYTSYETVEQKRKFLEDVGGITKITPSSLAERKGLKEIVSQYEDLECFEILNDKGVDVILRFRKDDPKIDVGGVMKSAVSAYVNGDCRRCFKKGMVALKTAMYPTAEIYDVMGASCYKLKDYERAYDYLRIGCHIDNVKDYEKLSLEEMVGRVEDKMKYIDKSNKNDYNFFNSEREVHIDGLRIPNFDKIINYAEENKLDLETAGKKLGLSNEQIDLMKLIFAREFYKQGDIDKGNYYLNSVEKTRGKTNQVSRLCLEARTNKLFFQYRDDNNPKKLSLIKPGTRKQLNK